MSFLDNLENTLKSLESRDERGPEDRSRREAERVDAIAAAPWAEQLKSSPFTQALMGQATRAGHQLRSKVYLSWLGTTLRLECRGQKLELRPTAEGINGVMLNGTEVVQERPVALSGDPQEVLGPWLARVEAVIQQQTAAPPQES